MLGSEELTASSREHADLLVLLEAGKADEAAELMHRHIGHVVGWCQRSREQFVFEYSQLD